MDLNARLPRETGNVFRKFSQQFSIADLDGLKLWQRLDARINELGGTQKVIASYKDAQQLYDRQSIATTAL